MKFRVIGCRCGCGLYMVARPSGVPLTIPLPWAVAQAEALEMAGWGHAPSRCKDGQHSGGCRCEED